MVPWSHGPVWPRGSSPAWLRLGVPGSRIGGPVAPVGVLSWSRGPVVPAGSRLAPCLVPSQASVGCPRIQIRWPGGPARCGGLVPWSRAPVWLPSGPVLRPKRGLDQWPAAPESVAQWHRSVCWLGPVVPWSRLAPVWPRASGSAWLRIIAAPIQNRSLGVPVRCAPVVPWSRGPVWPLSL